jgi:hypothetical protein
MQYPYMATEISCLPRFRLHHLSIFLGCCLRVLEGRKLCTRPRGGDRRAILVLFRIEKDGCDWESRAARLCNETVAGLSDERLRRSGNPFAYKRLPKIAGSDTSIFMFIRPCEAAFAIRVTCDGRKPDISRRSDNWLMALAFSRAGRGKTLFLRDGPRVLMLRSENGAPMKSVTLLSKMYELGVTPSRGRPCISKDNPLRRIAVYSL